MNLSEKSDIIWYQDGIYPYSTLDVAFSHSARDIYEHMRFRVFAPTSEFTEVRVELGDVMRRVILTMDKETKRS